MPVRLLALLLVLALPLGAAAQNKVPKPQVLEALVKVSLLSLNDAIVTGNYTVFHAKLSKPFRDASTYDPAPLVDDDGKLLVKGYFPTEPRRLHFDRKFIPSDGEWKVLGIGVDVK